MKYFSDIMILKEHSRISYIKVRVMCIVDVACIMVFLPIDYYPKDGSEDFLPRCIAFELRTFNNRPFSYSTKEPGSGVIFIPFYSRGSIEWR